MSAKEIEICEAIPAHRESISSMAGEVVEAGNVLVFENVSDVLDYWFDPVGHVYVGVRGDDVSGTYVVKPNQKGRGAHVANAGYMVSGSTRGQGIGTKIGSHSMEMARSLGFRAMQFNMVVATNSGASHVWSKFGFETVGRLPGVTAKCAESAATCLRCIRYAGATDAAGAALVDLWRALRATRVAFTHCPLHVRDTSLQRSQSPLGAWIHLTLEQDRRMNS